MQTYILGGKSGDVTITPNYLGSARLVQLAIASLATDRALLLVGEPGTAKSWLSEHLTAAICGNSLLLVRGTAGTTEEQIRLEGIAGVPPTVSQTETMPRGRPAYHPHADFVGAVTFYSGMILEDRSCAWLACV